MITLAILLILIGLSLYGLKEFYQVKLGVVPQQTPPAAITALAALLERSAAMGTFLDLGSGYGQRVITLAKRLPGWDITGVEQSPTPWIIANLRTFGKNFDNYRFFLSNPMEWSLQEYDVIFLHQNEATLKKWESSIARRLVPGTLVITLNHGLPRIKPIDVMTVNAQTTLYLYKKSANAAQTAQQAPVLPLSQEQETGEGFHETPEEEGLSQEATLPL